nr:protein transport protein sso2 [Quercus suber]
MLLTTVSPLNSTVNHLLVCWMHTSDSRRRCSNDCFRSGFDKILSEPRAIGKRWKGSPCCSMRMSISVNIQALRASSHRIHVELFVLLCNVKFIILLPWLAKLKVVAADSAKCGNPYGAAEESTTSGGYGTSSNPYATDAGNPYDQAGTTRLGQSTQTQTQYQTSSTSQQHFDYVQQEQQLGTHPVSHAHEHGRQPVQYVSPSTNVLSNGDFLARVEAVKSDIRTLTTHVGQIATLHQRALSSPDSGSSSSLESMITQTQVLNTSIKDQIKSLETDSVRSKDNNVKKTQIGQLKSSFAKQLQEYRVEEANYEKRYQEQIARQYRIVNPEATEAEVQEAVQADWGNEGVFQTALKSNRSATASTVLGAVRARHNDILKIEQTLIQLNQLMEDLATQIVLQESAIQATEEHTVAVKNDTEAANVQLDKGIASARRARKMKWWCFFICLAIVIILALILGLYFGLMHTGGNNNNR